MDASKTKECPVFGLDIGSNAVTGIVGYMDNDKFIVKAVEASEHEKPSYIDGKDEDLKRISDTVKNVKEKLEEKCGFHLKDVCIAASGRYLKTVRTTVELSFDDEKTVEESDLLKLNELSIERAYKTLEERYEFGKKHYCATRLVWRVIVALDSVVPSDFMGLPCGAVFHRAIHLISMMYLACP